MRRPRRPRTLTGEEARLWAEIAKLIKPLRGRARPEAPKPDAAAATAALVPGLAATVSTKPGAGRPAKARKTALPAVPRQPKTEAPKAGLAAKPGPAAKPVRMPTAAPYQAPPPVPRPPAGLERQARLGLRRGSLAIEARIDLHGMYQDEAHAALTGFLLRARAAGHAHVLVVTGKGGPDFRDAFSERGVLRRSVPHWLRGPDLHGIVLGFEEAAQHHGGSGALYVRLRRR